MQKSGGEGIMIYEKKKIIKEDGRILIFYHFPRSANHEQFAAFEKVAEPAEKVDSARAEKIV